MSAQFTRVLSLRHLYNVAVHRFMVWGAKGTLPLEKINDPYSRELLTSRLVRVYALRLPCLYNYAAVHRGAMLRHESPESTAGRRCDRILVNSPQQRVRRHAINYTLPHHLFPSRRRSKRGMAAQIMATRKKSP